EDDDRSLTLDGQTLALEILHDRSQPGVVEALAQLHVEPDAHPVVHGLERAEAVGHEPAPEGAVLGIAGVEPGGLLARATFGRRVAALDPGLDRSIQPRQLADRVAGVMGLIALVLPAPEDHAELRAPVPQVIVPDDPMPQGLEDPGQAVAPDRR